MSAPFVPLSPAEPAGTGLVRRLIAELRAALAGVEGPLLLAEIGAFEDTHLDVLLEWLRASRVEPPASVVRRWDLGGPEGSPRESGLLGVLEVPAPGGGRVFFGIDLVHDGLRGPEVVAVAAYRDPEDLRAVLDALSARRDRDARERGFVRLSGRRSRSWRQASWDDVVLPEGLLEDVRRVVADFATGRERYERLGLPWRRGLLLMGPPGNGKTLVCRAIASTSGLPFVYFGVTRGSEDYEVEAAFDRARRLAPAILCLEDVDSLFQSEVSLSFFLNELDGFEDNTGLLVLATTNHAERLDPALLRRPSRFDRVWWIPDPARAQRRRFLRRLLPELDEAWIEDLSARTDGFSMAYLQELRVVAALRAHGAGREVVAPEDAAAALRVLAGQLRTASVPEGPGRSVGFGVRAVIDES